MPRMRLMCSSMSSRIGKITTAGTTTDYATPTSGSAPFGIAECDDDTMYFTESAASQVGVVNLDCGRGGAGGRVVG